MKQFDDFSENDLISYIKENDLSSPVVIILDIISPFSNIIAFATTVVSPVLCIFIKSENVEALISLLKDRSQLRQLKKKLLEET